MKDAIFREGLAGWVTDIDTSHRCQLIHPTPNIYYRLERKSKIYYFCWITIDSLKSPMISELWKHAKAETASNHGIVR